MKNAINQVAYFLNGPMFSLLFYCHIILYWQKLTSYEKFSHNLTLEVQIVWKISVFYTINGNIEMLQNSYEVQTVNHLKEIIQPYPFHILSDKISLHLWNKNFLREIYRNIQVSAFKKWCCANNFFGTKQKHVCSKTCEVRNIFVAFREHIIFNVKSVEVRNMTEVFWAKLYRKMSDLFR